MTLAIHHAGSPSDILAWVFNFQENHKRPETTGALQNPAPDECWLPLLKLALAIPPALSLRKAGEGFFQLRGWRIRSSSG